MAIKFTLIKKLKKNNRFNYTPRYYKGKNDIDEGKYPTKIDAYAESYNNNDYRNHWYDARVSKRNRGNSGLNKTIVIVALVLVLIFLYLIDFDLTIFTQAR